MDQPIQPVKVRIRTTAVDKTSPQGTTELQASRVCTSMLRVARTSTTPFPTACGQAGGWARMARFPTKSIRPAIPAKKPTTTPTETSQAEKLLHIISAVRQYATSDKKVPTKQAIGMGTSMG